MIDFLKRRFGSKKLSEIIFIKDNNDYGVFIDDAQYNNITWSSLQRVRTYVYCNSVKSAYITEDTKAYTVER